MKLASHILLAWTGACMLGPRLAQADQYAAPTEATAAQTTAASQASLAVGQTQTAAATTSVNAAKTSVNSATANYSNASATVAMGTAATSALGSAAQSFGDCSDNATAAIASAVAGQAATQAMAQQTMSGTCQPLLSNPTTEAQGNECMQSVNMARAAGLAQIAAQIAQLAAQKDSCDKQKQDTEALIPAAQQIVQNGQSKTPNTTVSPGTKSDKTTTNLANNSGTTDHLPSAAANKFGLTAQTPSTSSTPSSLPSVDSTGGAYVSGQAPDKIEEGLRASADAKSRGLASAKDSNAGNFFSDAAGFSLGKYNFDAPAEAALGTEVQTKNNLQRYDAISGVELDIWQLATRRYSTQNPQRYLFLSRSELIRQQAEKSQAPAPH